MVRKSIKEAIAELIYDLLKTDDELREEYLRVGYFQPLWFQSRGKPKFHKKLKESLEEYGLQIRDERKITEAVHTYSKGERGDYLRSQRGIEEWYFIEADLKPPCGAGGWKKARGSAECKFILKDDEELKRK